MPEGTPPHDDPAALLRRASDRAAAEPVVRRYMPRLLRMARRLVRCEAEARKAVADGFRSARESSEDGTETLAGEVRRHAVRRAIAGDCSCATRPELPAEACRARAAVDALPAPYRTAFVLRDVEGVDRSEAAGLLRLSAPELDERVHRARQALVTLLAGS
jgi:RNA polymerase sigma-70 factor (ECF subfamily)